MRGIGGPIWTISVSLIASSPFRPQDFQIVCGPTHGFGERLSGVSSPHDLQRSQIDQNVRIWSYDVKVWWGMIAVVNIDGGLRERRVHSWHHPLAYRTPQLWTEGALHYLVHNMHSGNHKSARHAL